MQTCPQFAPEQLRLSTARPLGAGAIAHVVRSTLRGRSRLPIAVKIVSKLQALQQKKVASVMNEKAALLRLAPHPYIARLYGTSQSDDELYFVMEWLPHGDLLQHIRRTASARVRAYAAAQQQQQQQHGGDDDSHAAAATTPRTREQLDNDDVATLLSTSSSPSSLRPIPSHSRALRCLDFHDVQLITAQLVLALARVFECGLVLRDLKPENVAFDAKHRACLLDFDVVDVDAAALRPHSNHGVALPRDNDDDDERDDKANVRSDNKDGDSAATTQQQRRRRMTVSAIQRMRTRTASFCGTAQYVSPEMVGECAWSFASDLWALGAIVYEMVYGVHMFAGVDAFSVLQKVVHGVAQTQTHDAADNSSNSGSSSNGILRDDDDDGDCGSLRVPFPPVDLGPQPRAFARMRDLVLRLMHTDPCARLGVAVDTHTFDLAAVQQHAFFAEVDWAALQAHVRDFRPRRFAVASSSSSAHDDNDDDDDTAYVHKDCDDDDDDDEAAALQRAMLAYSVDDATPSLRACYHVVPRNDAAYADYVYKATADANPFERFMCMLAMDEHSDATKTTTTATADTDAGNSDSDDGVIDDVGMRYTGGRADDDFQR